MKKTVKNNDVVTTGQYLGVVEEYLPDEKSTFIMDGQIYAATSGTVSIDYTKREIEILTHQEKDRKTIKVGDLVIGTVVFLRKFSIELNLVTINDKIHFNSSYIGNIHISQISKRYVEKINDVFQKTDIVCAKVIGQNINEYNLSTVGKNLGVIHADCVICGSKLQKFGFNKLKCKICGNIEKRKLSSDYGNISYLLRF